MSFKYNGSVRSGNVDGLFKQMTDTGTIPNNPNADFVIGGCGRDYGTPTGPAKVRISELLIWNDAFLHPR